MAPYHSIVIPAFNEARRLPASLSKLAEFCAGAPWPLEVLVMVEQSSDETLEAEKECVRRHARCPNSLNVIDNGPQRGKGHAVRSGMLQARGELVFYMDADLSVPLQEIYPFVKRFEEDSSVDVLIGNRQHPQSRITIAQGFLRRSMGLTFNRVISLLALTRIGDTQCGFKALRREASTEIFSHQRLDGFAFDVEVLMLARQLGYRVADMPIEWINSPESKVDVVRDSLRMLRDVIKVWVTHFSSRPRSASPRGRFASRRRHGESTRMAVHPSTLPASPKAEWK